MGSAGFQIITVLPVVFLVNVIPVALRSATSSFHVVLGLARIILKILDATQRVTDQRTNGCDFLTELFADVPEAHFISKKVQ